MLVCPSEMGIQWGIFPAESLDQLADLCGPRYPDKELPDGLAFDGPADTTAP